MDGLFWLAWALAFFAYEGFALWRAEDGWRPLTYHVRNVFSLRKGSSSPGWWLIAGAIAWLGYHFLIESL